ncbi:unnamed protein product [Cylindrotheca closterium]|uniref:Uncharacterized protein n=1 Tax=Cylindrotheca closterium TaxID=2856 RepID=A0AAD2CR28_9STRA|nr:unnamed protein product [Cylindrotheca closterium]
MTTTIPLLTPRQVIFHSADLLLAKKALPDDNVIRNAAGKPMVQIQGQVALWDPELQRLDMVHQGAKLIVRTTQSCDVTCLEVGKTVVVEGVLKKEQRRTFLEATKVQIMD